MVEDPDKRETVIRTSGIRSGGELLNESYMMVFRGSFCSFCGKMPTEVTTLVVGLKASICNECLALVAQINQEGLLISHKTKPDCACTFCGKSHQQVKTLVAGPDVFICNECGEYAQSVFLGSDTE